MRKYLRFQFNRESCGFCKMGEMHTLEEHDKSVHDSGVCGKVFNRVPFEMGAPKVAPIRDGLRQMLREGRLLL